MKKYVYPVKSRERRAREKGSSKSLLERKLYLLDRLMEPNKKSRNRPKCLEKFSLQYVGILSQCRYINFLVSLLG